MHRAAYRKGDNPVVIEGSVAAGTWRLLYPLTPQRCFIAGPALENEPERLVPHQFQLADTETIAVNEAVCAYADMSVIGLTADQRIDPRPTIKAFLPKQAPHTAMERPFWGLSGVPRVRKIKRPPRK